MILNFFNLEERNKTGKQLIFFSFFFSFFLFFNITQTCCKKHHTFFISQVKLCNGNPPKKPETTVLIQRKFSLNTMKILAEE